MLCSFSDTYKNYLSQLLPYQLSDKKNKDLKTGLIEYKMLLEALKSSIHDYRKGDFEKFDGLVGENACQIRAIWLTLVADEQFMHFDELNDQIVKIQNNIDKILLRDVASFMHRGITLEQLFSDKTLGLEIILSKAEMFLLQIYLLRIAKVRKSVALCGSECSDPKPLKQFGDVSSNFIRNLLQKCKKNTAVDSINFIRKSAEELDKERLIEMASEEFTIKHNGLNCIPMFWTYQTVLELAKKKGIPILLHVKFLTNAHEEQSVTCWDEEYVLFGYGQCGGFVQQEMFLEDSNRAVCIVQGVCVAPKDLDAKERWKVEIQNYCPERIILAGAADHRQYPDPEQDVLIDQLNDQEYEYYKQLAVKEGFSMCNPSRFFIQHVYAAKLGRVLAMAEASAEKAVDFS